MCEHVLCMLTCLSVCIFFIIKTFVKFVGGLDMLKEARD